MTEHLAIMLQLSPLASATRRCSTTGHSSLTMSGAHTPSAKTEKWERDMSFHFKWNAQKRAFNGLMIKKDKR